MSVDGRKQSGSTSLTDQAIWSSIHRLARAGLACAWTPAHPKTGTSAQICTQRATKLNSVR